MPTPSASASLCARAARAAYSFISTPIFYVNAAPHIGHLYTAVLSDAAHRWQQMLGATPSALTTGTDEHGLKIQKAAGREGIPPRQLCDRISGKFKELFDLSGVDNTDYIRTTQQRHIQTVQRFWNCLAEKGHLYKGSYEGWYSVQDECFLSPSQVTDGMEPGSKVSMETGHHVEWSSEENYLFRLTSFQDQLLEWIDDKPYPVIPESSRQLVRHWIQNDLTSDLSVSRPTSRLSWGIPVPNDDKQTIYVWLDALVNYLTVSHPHSSHPHPSHPHSSHPHSSHSLTGPLWPATAHVVGKDILKFHAVYWPAFLMAAGLPLPQRIVSHAHWLIGRSKMSKSKGNVVDPFDQVNKYGLDSVRYFLLRESSLQQDGDYSEERLVALVNSDLSNTLGNLLQRVTSTKLNPGEPRITFSAQIFPPGGSGLHNSDYLFHDLLNTLTELPATVAGYYDDYEFSRGLEAVMQCLYKCNQFIQSQAPWNLVRDPSQYPRLHSILAVAVETIRLSALLLHPVIPTSAQNIVKRIGFEQDLNLKSRPPSTIDPLHCYLTSTEGVKYFNDTNYLTIGSAPIFTRLK